MLTRLADSALLIGLSGVLIHSVGKRSFSLLGGQRTAYAEADMALPELMEGGAEPTGGTAGTGITAPGTAAYHALSIAGFLVHEPWRRAAAG